ncbi:hypothetical protein LZ30DRAFT_349122 [Colletotrichum cereale]|nr:hypothetical protein LZ30DRAFT_349122 [Colletotrichum cereale]
MACLNPRHPSGWVHKVMPGPCVDAREPTCGHIFTGSMPISTTRNVKAIDSVWSFCVHICLDENSHTFPSQAETWSGQVEAVQTEQILSRYAEDFQACPSRTIMIILKVMRKTGRGLGKAENSSLTDGGADDLEFDMIVYPLWHLGGLSRTELGVWWFPIMGAKAPEEIWVARATADTKLRIVTSNWTPAGSVPG